MKGKSPWFDQRKEEHVRRMVKEGRRPEVACEEEYEPYAPIAINCWKQVVLIVLLEGC